MKAINLVVITLASFSIMGCLSPYGTYRNRGQQQQSPYDFALQQSEEMKISAGQIMDNVLNEHEPCTGNTVGESASVASVARIDDRNGAVSFHFHKKGMSVRPAQKTVSCTPNVQK